MYKIPDKQTSRKGSVNAIPRKTQTFLEGDGAEWAAGSSARLLLLIPVCCTGDGLELNVLCAGRARAVHCTPAVVPKQALPRAVCYGTGYGTAFSSRRWSHWLMLCWVPDPIMSKPWQVSHKLGQRPASRRPPPPQVSAHAPPSNAHAQRSLAATHKVAVRYVMCGCDLAHVSSTKAMPHGGP